MSDEDDTKRLVVAITDFLRDQLASRENMTPEDKDSLEIAVECLEMAYGLENHDYTLLRFSRPLQDMFSQVANPVPVKAKLEADEYKVEGNRKMTEGQFQEALDLYSRAIELDKWNAIYYCNRAGARIELRNFFDAVEDCRFALTLSPDYAKAYARMGQAYALMSKHRRAAWCYRKALDLEPENEQYRNNLSVSESHSGLQGSLSFIQNVLSSIFGPGSSQQGNDFGSFFMPSTVTIITRSPQHVSETDNQTSLDESNSTLQGSFQIPVENGNETGYDSSTNRPDMNFQFPFQFTNQNTCYSTPVEYSPDHEESGNVRPSDQSSEPDAVKFSVSSIPAEYYPIGESPVIISDATTESNLPSDEIQQNDDLSQSDSDPQENKSWTSNVDSKESPQINDSNANDIRTKQCDKTKTSVEDHSNSISTDSAKSKNGKSVNKKGDSSHSDKKDNNNNKT